MSLHTFSNLYYLHVNTVYYGGLNQGFLQIKMKKRKMTFSSVQCWMSPFYIMHSGSPYTVHFSFRQAQPHLSFLLLSSCSPYASNPLKMLSISAGSRHQTKFTALWFLPPWEASLTYSIIPWGPAFWSLVACMFFCKTLPARDQALVVMLSLESLQCCLWTPQKLLFVWETRRGSFWPQTKLINSELTYRTLLYFSGL